MSTQDVATQSSELYERALKVLPGGVSRNTLLRDPHPAYADQASGCHIVDLEGKSRIDFANNMASLVHGHADPDIVRAVSAQLERGTAYTMATEIEVRYAEHLCSRIESFDKMRFVNSGTEAVMVGMKAARAWTGRPKIAKVEGAYHGGYDYVEVSQAPSPATWGNRDRPRNVPLVHGTPQSALSDVVILPFNDPERAIKILDEHCEDLACVLLDLMPHRVGLQLADPEFVHAIRDWTVRHGALLVLDEVVTFRCEHGGLQARYDIHPDLTALGKMIGGGFPIGAIGGRSEVMDVLNPRAKRVLYPHSGTFSANPISTTAGLIALEKFDAEAIKRLNTLTKRLLLGIEDAIRKTGARACVSGGGSMIRVHIKEHVPHNYREVFASPEEQYRLKVLLDHLFDEGFLMINTCAACLSTPMTEVEVDALISAFVTGFEKITETA